MKKIYLSLLLGGLTIGSATAQRAAKPLSSSQINPDNKQVTQSTGTPKAGVTIWTDNFDNPGDWTIDNDGQTGSTFGWTVDATNDGWWSANGISSTSGGNYAELSNGDPTVGDQALNVTYTLTTANPIDIPNLPLNTTNTDFVTLQFEEYGARFNDLQEVYISTDGVTWVPVRNNYGYPVYSQAGGAPYANPETVQVNLAPYIAGNANSVYIRFQWTTDFPGSTNPNAWVTYGWYIDDLKLITNPDDDLQLWSTWIAGANNEFIEYGRMPQDQLDANWIIGGQVYNNGVNDQANVTLDADFSSFTAQAIDPLLPSGDTIFLETTDPVTMTPGVYTGNYTVTSNAEQPGAPDFGDNTGMREFEVTVASTSPGSIYSQDGVGVYSSPTTSSLGTNSFTGGEDGFVCATKYHIKQTCDISGFRVMLESGTQAGGELFGSILDTSLFWQGDMTPMYQTNLEIITQFHINQGYIDLMFQNPVSLSPNAYYAGVEMYSNGGTANIRILNDETVAQPWDASAIFIPNDQSYSNGVAFGIRLLMGDSWLGLDDNTLTGVSVYPNPSEGIVTVTNDSGTANTINVYDMAGNIVLTKETSIETTIDLSAIGTGMYVVKVSNDKGTFTENVVIK